MTPRPVSTEKIESGFARKWGIYGYIVSPAELPFRDLPASQLCKLSGNWRESTGNFDLLS